MRGYNVFFPQGWDCHGLPTEVRVEKTIGKKKSEIDPEEFLRLAKEFTWKWIKPMKKALKSLGMSIDWTTEYVTMDPDYWRRTQLSFILLYRKGLVYRGEHPVLWCPRCETAIAESEVEYVQVTRSLYYFKFKLKDEGEVTVASTRPELLPSCVALAVNPEDERYKHLVGKTAVVPIYGREIPIIADEEVDPKFGTGIVMICTYGDKTDVEWQVRHNLPVIISINEKGVMNENAGPLKGLTVNEARKRIVKLLQDEGLLVKVEQTQSNVGTCWRCHTPVEIIPREQWFIRTIKFSKKVLEEAKKIKWIPEHAIKKLENWVNSLDWDWVISRERVFGTPFPVYYCKKCGAELVVDPDKVPIDPRKDPPPFDKCPKCGSTEFVGETRVMDTWMDSSITAAVHAGWPDNLDERLFPADLQPNGYDIIRTWDYYLIVRGLMLFGKPQFKIALINGMVRGTDGRMMHKSYGNYVSLLEVIDKYGADAFRIWVAMAAATGSDVRFSWEGIKFASKFLTKVWNAARLIYFYAKEEVEEVTEIVNPIDHWILKELSETINHVTNALEEYDYQGAITKLVDFTWHRFCDHYLEAVKYRLVKGDKAAKYVMKTAFLRTLQMLSVFAPHISEELYHRLYDGEWKSITILPWPQPMKFDKDKAFIGEVTVAVIARTRSLKYEMKIPLNQPVSRLYIKAGKYRSDLEKGVEDIKGTLKIGEIVFVDELEEGIELPDYPEIKVKLEP